MCITYYKKIWPSYTHSDKKTCMSISNHYTPQIIVNAYHDRYCNRSTSPVCLQQCSTRTFQDPQTPARAQRLSQTMECL